MSVQNTGLRWNKGGWIRQGRGDGRSETASTMISQIVGFYLCIDSEQKPRVVQVLAFFRLRGTGHFLHCIYQNIWVVSLPQAHPLPHISEPK